MLPNYSYQVGIKVLQAVRYGVPQKRERVIIMAAKLGLDMPKYPMPTHATSQVSKWKISDKWPINPLYRHIVSEEDLGDTSAPSRSVTVKDAISDLVRVLIPDYARRLLTIVQPPFEWYRHNHLDITRNANINICP